MAKSCETCKYGTKINEYKIKCRKRKEYNNCNDLCEEHKRKRGKV